MEPGAQYARAVRGVNAHRCSLDIPWDEKGRVLDRSIPGGSGFDMEWPRAITLLKREERRRAPRARYAAAMLGG